MRVLVCGGRGYSDAEAVARALNALRPSLVIHGAARGADALAATWAAAYGIPAQPFPADWETYGRAAGHVRNARMLAEGKPDLVVAFPGGRGTEDMKRRARKAGVEVREVLP